MNKNQFYENLRKQKIQEQEIQRKWRAIAEEKEFYERMMMFEAARGSSSAVASGAGGGGGSVSTITGSAGLYAYVDAATSEWKMFVVDFSASTISPDISTGLFSPSAYVDYDNRICQNAGFTMVFYDPDSAAAYCYFIDLSGNIIDSISTGGGYAVSDVDGIGTVFIDYDPTTIIKIFNGTTVTTYSTNESVNWIDTSSFNGESTQDFTVPLYFSMNSGPDKLFLAKSNGNLIEVSSLLNPTDTYYAYAPTSSFMCFLGYNGSFYTDLKITDQDGNILHDIDLTPYTVNQFSDFSMCGGNKFIACLYNGGDTNVDYRIIHYNGNTGVLDNISHNRSNYTSVYSFYSYITAWSSAVWERTNMVIGFANFPGGGGLFESYVDYLDYVYSIGDGPLNVVTITDDSTIETYLGFSTISSKNPLFLYYDSGTYIKYGILTSGGTVSTGDTAQEYADPDYDSWSSDYTRDYSVIYFTRSSNRIYEVYSSSKIASKTTSPSTYTDGVSGSTYVILDNAGNSFYISPSGITDISSYYDNSGGMETDTRYGMRDGVEYGYSIVWKEEPNSPSGFLIVKPDGSSVNSPSIPDTSDTWSVYYGESIVSYRYKDEVTGNWIFNIYDLNTGSLLQSLDTGYTSYYTSNRYGDRIDVGFNPSGNIYEYYFITRNGILSKTIEATNTNRAYNDTYWAD